MVKEDRIYIELDVSYDLDVRMVEVSPLAELLYIRCRCATKRLDVDDLSDLQILRIGDDIFDPGIDFPTIDGLTQELLSVGLFETKPNGQIEVLV